VIKWVIAGGVVVAGGFAFWLYHSHAVAAAAAAAAPVGATGGPAPSLASRLGGFVGGAVAHLLPVPGLGPAGSAYGASIYDSDAKAIASVGGGVKALVTGHPITAAKTIAVVPVKLAAAPVKAVGAVFKHLF
jgi:hypothetical protein